MRGCGCIVRPGLPARSEFQGTGIQAKLARIARRDREAVSGLAVLARSEATKQSILSCCCAMDCFASLAMTLLGCLKIESMNARHPSTPRLDGPTVPARGRFSERGRAGPDDQTVTPAPPAAEPKQHFYQPLRVIGPEH